MKKHDALTHIVNAFSPVDLEDGAQSGDWVSLAKYDSLTVVYSSDVGTATEDVTVKLREAKTAAGGDAKDLAAGQWYAAQHATALTDALTATGTPGSFTDDGETLCIARVEVTADQLDVAGGFQFVQVTASDPGSTAGKLASAVYILRGARWAIEVPEQPTALK